MLNNSSPSTKPKLVIPSITLEKIKGTINKIIFLSPDKGFAIISLVTDDFDEIQAIGIMPDARVEASVELSGNWKIHDEYGEQFKFKNYIVHEPTDDAGIAAFIQTLDGVGENTARRIVERFGKRSLEVIEEHSEELLEIKGVTQKKLGKIKASFFEKKGLSKLVSFLHSLGVSVGYAAKLHKYYGDDAIRQIKLDPYILCQEVKGFGFKRADEVAIGLQIALDAPNRIKAAIFCVLRLAASESGHCFLPRVELESEVINKLAVPGHIPQLERVSEAIELMISIGGLVEDEKDGTPIIYLTKYYEAEVDLAENLKSLAGVIKGVSLDEIDSWFEEYSKANSIQLSSGQEQAIITAAMNGLTVITGGAGTGKSTISKAIIEYWHKKQKRIIAVAPTGKAAQRIQEVTGLTTASTIHRLLGWDGSGFLHNENNLIEADAFVIDESSMMDLLLAVALFRAIPPHACVVMVGDIDQLPSVGAGSVLKDIMNSGQIPVVRLTEIFRQAQESSIIQSSICIKQGELPCLETISRTTGQPKTDALWVKCAQNQIRSAIKWLLTDKLPELGFQPDQIQCLSPMNKGNIGNVELNKIIQEIWNPPDQYKPELNGFRIGDRVIQTVNDYDKKVFNGDIGVIEEIDLEKKTTEIRFPEINNEYGRLVRYSQNDLSDLNLAFSISIHKSQGAEFPVVIIPVSMEQYRMLQRNIYYTGITRGRQLAVIIGEEKPLQIAVKTNRIDNRNTKLAYRLR